LQRCWGKVDRARRHRRRAVRRPSAGHRRFGSGPESDRGGQSSKGRPGFQMARDRGVARRQNPRCNPDPNGPWSYQGFFNVSVGAYSSAWGLTLKSRMAWCPCAGGRWTELLRCFFRRDKVREAAKRARATRSSRAGKAPHGR
jgi:hypothetical protein